MALLLGTNGVAHLSAMTDKTPNARNHKTLQSAARILTPEAVM
jgi:hypothetical protein